jgi:hypothetical protein
LIVPLLFAVAATPAGNELIGTSISVTEAAGRIKIRLDLVDARIAWFSQQGSPTTDLDVDVVWSDSRDPHRFEARIEPVGSFPPTPREAGFRLDLRLTNAGDTIWLDGDGDERGTVRVGVQSLQPDGRIAERDYFRLPLPGRIAPGESAEIRATVPLRPGAGRHFALDLVAEHICWFADHGSQCLSFSLHD